MTKVIAFAGKIGSGKTTLTKALAESLGCLRASFGDYVRDVVRAQGLPPTRENLQRVGTQLLESDTNGFCRAVLSQPGWRPGEMLVIDGLRHKETVNPIKDIISPAELRIVFLSVDENTRLARLAQRGDADISALTRADAHSSELQVGSTLCEMADLVLEGDESVEDTVLRVGEWIRTQ